MTDEARSGGPPGPPWSVDVLADLHAGALSPEQSTQLWPAVNADPSARAVIEALDLVKVDLGNLGTAPVGPMPAHFAARLDAAIAAEANRMAAPVPLPAPRQPVAPVIDLAAARKRRNRMLGWGAGVLTAAAAAVAVVVAVFPGSSSTPGSAVAGGGPNNSADGPLAVQRDNVSAAIGKVTNQRDYGPLKDQQHLDACLKAGGIDPGKEQTAGVRQVVIDGRSGVMALLVPGNNTLRVVVVEPTCGPDNPGLIVNTTIPRG
jgi:hypothetical protein